MIDYMKQRFTPIQLMKGNFGIEREGLRCDKNGVLAFTPHPSVFGDKLSNPYITTDFSESQIELITPVFHTLEETYSFLKALYEITVLEIGDEYLWPQSMPCIIPPGVEIPIATFCSGLPGREAYDYRKKLLAKYGGKKQLLSGIHYNFSFDEEIIIGLYERETIPTHYKTFRNQIYLKVARNYLRYRWLLIYLLGSTSVMHESYEEECVKRLKKVHTQTYSNRGALSYRNSECGYTNKVELFPNYDSVNAYIASLEAFINEDLLDSPKELYSQIRLKARDNSQFLTSLKEDGILYLEYRSIDINPFDPAGIALDDLYFMHLFNLFLLLKDEPSYKDWQEEALQNQRSIARFGQTQLLLSRNGLPIDKTQWGLEILEEMKVMVQHLSLGKEALIDQMIDRLKNDKHTYAYRITKEVKTHGYIAAHLNLAKSYKKDAYNYRYRLNGYEDMELSTQLLMKEAIKKGVSVSILDRSENFISLRKNNIVHPIKQATKTALDNYITVLMMENKTVTKHILNQHHIQVPQGQSFDNKSSALAALPHFIHQPVVVKPKSTNFGLGISIFPNGANEEDLKQAIGIAFEHDQTILIEAFITGKEYRFLVMGDAVVGILHRVPANVMGDGTHTIEQLVAEKNNNPLRGKGYKTPLEKIQLDQSALLFLKQQHLNEKSIPAAGEVVYLRENSNISTGGDSIDYTDCIPDYFKEIALQAARAVGAKICGVDMMIDDYNSTNPKYAIIELNFNPAIHIHCYPYQGKERPIAQHLLHILGY